MTSDTDIPEGPEFEQPEGTQTRAGFIAVLGAPNAGKSTLVNRLVGTKVSIVTHKVQTTRTRVLGICMHGQSQVILVDTPGIFAPQRRLDRAMVAAAWQGAEDADVSLLLVDATKGITDNTRTIMAGLKKRNRTCYLALNKIDAVDKPKLLDLAQTLGETGLFEGIFMISALKGGGVDELMDQLAQRMPYSPWLFDPDQVSDMPMRLLAAEVTREKLFMKLHQEIPYQVTVETESWEERKDGSIKVDQVIYVQRETQRKIVLGKGGQQIKSIGAESRKELQDMLECRVHLFLFVKVRESWGEDKERFHVWGLDFDA